MDIAVALACVLAAGCGRLGFDSQPAVISDAVVTMPDAARLPLALDPGFPILQR